MFLVIQEIIAHTKFIKSDNSVYKSSSLAVLATFTHFMMECNFLTTHKYGRTLLIGGYRYLTIRKGKNGKEFWRCSNCLCPTLAKTICNKPCLFIA